MIRIVRRGLSLLLGLGLLGRGATALAQHQPLPATLLSLDSKEGQRLLAESDAKEDFFPLVTQYVTQKSGNFCGVASSVMVLNSLQVPAPNADDWGAPYYTQENFWNGCARGVLSPTLMPGMTIDQLGDLLQCHPTVAHVVHAGDTTLEEFRSVAAKNLATAGDFVLVNYDRAGVGQEAMGHISPLGAYHAKSDKLLLLDVARYKYPPVWVDAAALFAAMRTNDSVSARTRGFVTVTAAAAPPGPIGVKPPRNPLHLAIAIGVGLFVLGAVLGGSVQTVRLRRRFRRAQAGTKAPTGG